MFKEADAFIKYLNERKISAFGNLFLCDPNDNNHQKNCLETMNETLFYKHIWKSPWDKKKDRTNVNEELTLFEKLTALEKLTARSDTNLFFLKGYEGTGKTTLLNGLLYNVKETNAKEKKGYDRINFDFNQDLGNLGLFNRNIVQEFGLKVSAAIGKFIVLLLYKFGEIVDRTRGMPGDFWSENSVFFDALEKNSDNGYDGSVSEILGDLENFIKKSKDINKAKIFQDIKNCFFKEEEPTNNIIPLMKSILYLQLSIACYNAKQDGFTDINLYWTFDNIERFITLDKEGYPIPNNEIAEIYNYVQSFSDYCMEHEDKFTYNGVKQQLKVIFVVRNVTSHDIKIFERKDAHRESLLVFLMPDLPKNQGGLHDLVTAKNIIENRYEFFKRLNGDSRLNAGGKKIVEKTLGKVGIIINLMDDDKTERSFKQAIEKMFNYDIRRIVNRLFEIVESDPVSHKYRALLGLTPNNYLGYLNKEEIKRIQRRTALNLVFSKVLDRDDILSELKLIPAGEPRQLGYSYARQILTYLYNMSKDGKTVTFYRFKEDLCEYVETNREDHFKYLCRVLYSMYCYRTFNIWTQLVEIETSKDITNEDSLVKQIKYEYTEKISDSKLKITPAGEFLAFILCEFEYFAIRYMQSNGTPVSYPAALFLYDFKAEKKRITDTIRIISERALDCIDKAVDFDKNQCGENYSSGERGLHRKENYYLWRNEPQNSAVTTTTVTHPQRILDNFITYMDSYRRFVILKNKNDVDTCRDFSKLIIEEIEAFIKKMEELTGEIKNDIYYISGEHVSVIGTIKKIGERYDKYRQNVKDIKKLLEKLETAPSETGETLYKMGTMKIGQKKKDE
ncbi:MAG: hypothetical protein LBO65_02960 [Spirochaetaceae bacterium]|nr:hypothetical protein [Spirochaetaceae bacterium]